MNPFGLRGCTVVTGFLSRSQHCAALSSDVRLNRIGFHSWRACGATDGTAECAFYHRAASFFFDARLDWSTRVRLLSPENPVRGTTNRLGFSTEHRATKQPCLRFGRSRVAIRQL